MTGLKNAQLGLHIKTGLVWWIFPDGTFALSGPADVDSCLLGVKTGMTILMEKEPVEDGIRK